MNWSSITAGALVLALTSCGDGGSEVKQIEVAEDGFQGKLQAMPEGQRNAVFIRALRDAGRECQGVESSTYQGEQDGVPTWRARCTNEDGDWLILMLDSNIPATSGSPQFEFARAELQAQRTPCTMAVWHHPLFSSGPSGTNGGMRDMWALLEASRAEIVLTGHDHLYERFAKQTSTGRPDPVGGIRQFTAGTGGAELYNFVRARQNSEERITKFGVVRFTLKPGQVDWEFLGIDGSVSDPGLDTCR